ncbi:MAG: hypothetical protein U0996_04155 [Planctomycetaceae bacterium]
MEESHSDIESDEPFVLSVPTAMKGWLLAFIVGVLVSSLGFWWMSRPTAAEPFSRPVDIESPEAANSAFRAWLVSNEGHVAKQSFDPMLLPQETTELSANTWLLPCIDQVHSHKRYFYASLEETGPVTQQKLVRLLSDRYSTVRSDLIRDELIPLTLELLYPNARLLNSADDIPNHNPRLQGRTFVGRLDDDLIPLIRPASFRQATQTRSRYYVAYAWWPVNGEVIRLRLEVHGDNSDPDPEEGWRLASIDCRTIASKIGGQPGMQPTP